jgi:hypothetical protein
MLADAADGMTALGDLFRSAMPVVVVVVVVAVFIEGSNVKLIRRVRDRRRLEAERDRGMGVGPEAGLLAQERSHDLDKVDIGPGEVDDNVQR